MDEAVAEHRRPGPKRRLPISLVRCELGESLALLFPHTCMEAVSPQAPGGDPDLIRLRQAVDASGAIIFMTDREGVFTFVNTKFERVYGYSAGEVIGRVTPRTLKSGNL